MDVSAYPNGLVIRLTSSEALQALAIDLDEDATQALGFLREKIVEKLPNSACRPLPHLFKEPRRCVPGCKRPCCVTGHHLQANSA
jgi:hypothetical protein